MAKETMYRQCRLENKDGRQTISWLPEKFSKQDQIIKLKNDDGSWDNGWKVTVPGKELVQGKNLPDYHSEIKAHLRATGDAQK